MTFRWNLGVNITLNPAAADADVALAAKLGARCVRTSQEQGWGSVSSRLGPFATACQSRGVELFQTCQPTGHVVPKTQAGIDAYALFVAECANLADRTSTGNEVNGYGSNEPPNASGQAEMFVAAAEAVAKHCPGRRLATPAMAPASGQNEPLAFFLAMIAAQPGMLDVRGVEVDWHGYCGFGYPAGTRASWNQAWRTLALDQALAKLGFPKTRITWSEFGEPSGSNVGVSQAVQAQRFDDYLALLASTDFAHVHMGELIWYCLRDRAPANDGDWPAWCGLVLRDGTAKPVAARFAAAATLVA